MAEKDFIDNLYEKIKCEECTDKKMCLKHIKQLNRNKVFYCNSKNCTNLSSVFGINSFESIYCGKHRLNLIKCIKCGSRNVKYYDKYTHNVVCDIHTNEFSQKMDENFKRKLHKCLKDNSLLGTISNKFLTIKKIIDKC